MFRFLFKLSVIVIAIYFLSQFTFFSEKMDQLKASALEKAGNVAVEVDRVKGEIGTAKETVEGIGKKVSEAKDTLNEISETVTKTKAAFDLLTDDTKKEAVEVKAVEVPTEVTEE